MTALTRRYRRLMAMNGDEIAEALIDSVFTEEEDVYPRASLIYFALVGDLIKIGFTRRLEQREMQLRNQTGQEAQIIFYDHGTLEIEEQLHKMFAVLRTYGEFFKREEPLMRFIRLAKDNGLSKALNMARENDE